ncbi:hypothetical protein FQN49_007570 [Arthroderma sp. PD_2]|nr:hypothetical protein FQN49_007570 [Arthroderma sp. PD_2]
MPGLPLSFGIEMELHLKPKSQGLKDLMKSFGFKPKDNAGAANRLAFRHALSARLARAVPSRVDAAGDYTTWVVADEDLDEEPGFLPCEIISRVLYTNRGNWEGQIDSVFQVLHADCEIKLTPGCAMHVHVSPDEVKYDAKRLKNIIMAGIYYENPLATIMPPIRKNNPWARPNVQVLQGCMEKINMVPQKTWALLFDEYQKLQMRQQVLLAIDTGNRQVSWNFSNVASTCGTIEFRRPPGVKTSADAKHWAALTLGYMANAMELQNWDAIKKTKTHPTTNDLRNAINRGAQYLDRPVTGALRPALMADINSPPTVFSAAYMAKIKQKMAKKANKRSVFVENVINSRPNTPTGHK